MAERIPKSGSEQAKAGTSGVTPLHTAELRRTLEAAAREHGSGEAKVKQMEAYLRNQFRFLGLTSPVVRQATKPFLASGADAGSQQLLDAARWCWHQDEREFQYTGALLLRKWAKNLDPDSLQAVTAGNGRPSVEDLITTKSWWDTVDSLAPWTVGTMISTNPELVSVMDQWIEDDNIWLARTALLHQLSYKERTDSQRLFEYCSLRATDSEFFIRKAIGWALRQHARQDPDAVKQFVGQNAERLSGLSKREALKHLK